MRERRYFLESERLTREALRDQHDPVMVMCPVCNRSVPEGVPCMVCAPPEKDPQTGTTPKDLDRAELW
jgi:hypothetical protein